MVGSTDGNTEDEEMVVKVEEEEEERSVVNDELLFVSLRTLEVGVLPLDRINFHIKSWTLYVQTLNGGNSYRLNYKYITDMEVTPSEKN